MPSMLSAEPKHFVNIDYLFQIELYQLNAVDTLQQQRKKDWVSQNSAQLSGKGDLRILSVPKSSPDGFCGGAGYAINAVCSAILFIIQEPARVCQATDLNPRIPHLFQLLCYTVHIQEHPSSTSTATTRSIFQWD